MRRFMTFCLLGLIVIAGYVILSRPATPVTLVGAKAFAVSGQPGMYMVTLTIENAGAADELLAVMSPKADMVMLVNPHHSDHRVVVPGQGRGILAMDGAHVMLRMDGFAQGSFIPLTLTFENAGQVSTRLQNAGENEMSHNPSTGASALPAPQVSLHAIDAPDTDGFALRIAVENFTFHRAAEDAAHLTGQGHGHLYLNGLKLGRIYEPSFTIGSLPVGSHVLEIVLNTNDHRPYLDDGGVPVAARLALELSD